MPLSKEDIERITNLGYSEFYVEAEGERRLRNKEGLCWFLSNGKCRIYENRPEGCRLYPLILYEEENTVGLDSDCPHHDGFDLSEDAITKLLELVERLNIDA